ncbi:hypothetical protein BT69DRAFT_1354609 [Atractiella rhizophila]|nr:hypothetical protein BT69DRAFT_1354609 [Atractiella rhizophila]
MSIPTPNRASYLLTPESPQILSADVLRPNAILLVRDFDGTKGRSSFEVTAVCARIYIYKASNLTLNFKPNFRLLASTLELHESHNVSLNFSPLFTEPPISLFSFDHPAHSINVHFGKKELLKDVSIVVCLKKGYVEKMQAGQGAEDDGSGFKDFMVSYDPSEAAPSPSVNEPWHSPSLKLTSPDGMLTDDVLRIVSYPSVQQMGEGQYSLRLLEEKRWEFRWLKRDKMEYFELHPEQRKGLLNDKVKDRIDKGVQQYSEGKSFEEIAKDMKKE